MDENKLKREENTLLNQLGELDRVGPSRLS